jgi:hypothetical protein
MYAIQTFKPSLVTRGFEDVFAGSKPEPLYKAIFSVRIPEFDTHQATAYCMIFFSKSSSINSSQPGTYLYSTQLRQTSSLDGAAYFDVYADTLYAKGFAKGEKVYCQGYAAGYYCAASHYTDALTLKPIYTGFSPVNSGAKSFILP